MSTIIKDGKTGKSARVDSRNRLRTFAVTENSATDASLDGDTFTTTTGIITLTTDNPSALVWMDNTDTETWVISRVFVNNEVSVGGSGKMILEVIANASTGTLISAGSDLTPSNLNFGSPKELTSTAKEGGEGSTLTNGVSVINSIISTSGVRVLLAGDTLIVEPGSKVGIRLTPPVGNTSIAVQAGFVLHRMIP